MLLRFNYKCLSVATRAAIALREKSVARRSSQTVFGRPARAQNWSPNPARTRDRLTQPDPTRAAQLNLEPEPGPKYPPQTNSQLK